jgi:hypothetical protein
VYHKIYLGREELPRYDIGNKNCPADKTADTLLGLLESELGGYDCVIVNEQVPSGLHSPYFQEKLAALIQRNRGKVLWFSDCRKLNNRYNYTIRKLRRILRFFGQSHPQGYYRRGQTEHFQRRDGPAPVRPLRPAGQGV